MHVLRATGEGAKIFFGTGVISTLGEGSIVLGRATAAGLLGGMIANLAKINHELVQACF